MCMWDRERQRLALLARVLRACTQRLHCLLMQRLCCLRRKLGAQLAAAHELLQHNEKEAAAREESLSQAMAAGNK